MSLPILVDFSFLRVHASKVVMVPITASFLSQSQKKRKKSFIIKNLKVVLKFLPLLEYMQICVATLNSFCRSIWLMAILEIRILLNIWCMSKYLAMEAR
jgi:hypothetical protein